MRLLTVKIRHFLLSTLLLVSFTAFTFPVDAHAQPIPLPDSCEKYFLFVVPAWYNGVVKSSDGGCDIMSPTEVGGIGDFIWIVVLNIVELILALAGYAAVLFIIYGGYKYMTSAGSSEGISAAKKTIMNAVIGLVISIAAVAIVRSVSTAVGL